MVVRDKVGSPTFGLMIVEDRAVQSVWIMVWCLEVLLGEGYYDERTSKQTVEILQRRGKSLDSRVDSLEVNIKDLEAEASFLNATASFLVARFFWEKGIMLNF
ncbi:hypothetical protein glysoja_036166 [Glycine soja]|uniref:Uncharacterized protein n=1 Tax=Glycine soja TaxID=3848 RepID=A0A0B2QGU2_GLYSO|nr:hypothetical protein glysoja_036166 [Glycine soja]